MWLVDKIKGHGNQGPVRPLKEVKEVVHKNNRTYAIMPDGVGIPFEVYGQETGPPVVFTPGGKGGMERERDLAKSVSYHGFRTLIYDRRNTGAADCGYGDGSKNEMELQVADLLNLLNHLNMLPCIFVGESAGSRLSLLCALERPSAVKALVLRDMTAGQKAADWLSKMYYHSFVPICEEGGMEAVLKTWWASDIVRNNPDAKLQILETDPEVYMKVQRNSGDVLKNSADFPTLAIPAEALKTIDVPVILIRTMVWMGYLDGMHTLAALQGVSEHLPQAKGVIEPSKYWVDSRMVEQHLVAFLNEVYGMPPITPRQDGGCGGC